MIDINIYRIRIGLFSPKFRFKSVPGGNKNSIFKKTFPTLQIIFMFSVMASLILPHILISEYVVPTYLYTSAEETIVHNAVHAEVVAGQYQHHRGVIEGQRGVYGRHQHTYAQQCGGGACQRQLGALASQVQGVAVVPGHLSNSWEAARHVQSRPNPVQGVVEVGQGLHHGVASAEDSSGGEEGLYHGQDGVHGRQHWTSLGQDGGGGDQSQLVALVPKVQFVTNPLFLSGETAVEVQPRSQVTQGRVGVGQGIHYSGAVCQDHIGTNSEIIDYNFKARYLHGNIGNKKEIKGIKNNHLNIRSLRYKVVEIKNIIKEQNSHIIGLSECELKKSPNFNLKELKIPGYDLLLPTSWDSAGFARVAVYVKKTLQYTQVHELQDELVQSIWLKGGFKNSKQIFFCHGYREHKSSIGNSLNDQKIYLERFLDQWEAAIGLGNPEEPNEVHICCDMNVDTHNERWLKPNYPLVSLSRMIQSSCSVNNFFQLVTGITRTQYNRVSNMVEMSCIDHVYCNYKHRCSQVKIITNGASDHDQLSYTRYSKDPPSPARMIRKRSYKNFKLEEFIEDLNIVDWTEVYACEDVDMAAEVFGRKFRFVVNKHAPWVKIQAKKNFLPWLSSETKGMMILRDKWKSKAKELGNSREENTATTEESEAWSNYKYYRNKINNRKKDEERLFKAEKITENLNSAEQTWKTAKHFMNWKSQGSPSQLEIDGKLEAKPYNIAKHINDFFSCKVKDIRNSIGDVPPNLTICQEIMNGKSCNLSLAHVTVRKVKKLLKSLKTSKSTSIDEIDNYIVKISADVIAGPLHHIITLSIMQEKFPSCWKYGKVVPLHKKDSPLLAKNYRPVTILSPLSKVLEKLIFEQLYSYFSNNHIFHPNLHGYRENRSTQTALVQMYDRWVKAAAAKQVTGVVLLDLSAAFDLVDPTLLLAKLRLYGLGDDVLHWLESYLTGRQQGVWIDNVLSEFLPCEVGVPQGSILGPLLFLIFYNDLPYSIRCDVDAYADDSTLSATSKDTQGISDLLSESCSLVSQWMKSNKLKLNAGKTHLLTVGTAEKLRIVSEPVEVEMEGIRLAESDNKCELLLGVQIQASLKWHEQCTLLSRKLKTRLAGLGKLKFIVQESIRKTLAEGLFNSVLVYCLPLFGGCGKGDLQALQVLQNKAAQVVTKSPPRSNRDTMYDRLGWLTVNQLVFYHTVLSIFRIRQAGEPEYLARQLQNDNRNGRLIIPRCKLSLAQKSFCIRGAESWNSLPEHIRLSRKLREFKAKTRNWVQSIVPRFVQ